jgi:hypothetical protein
MSKFKKPESNPLLNPVDYFNFFGTFEQIFEGDKKCISYSNTEATYQSESTDKSPTFILTKDSNYLLLNFNTQKLLMVSGF